MSLLQYLTEYTAETESPKRYHQWCYVSAVAALLGRRYYLPFGDGEIYPNIFCMLIGSPGARKSTAIKSVIKLIKDTGYSSIAANKTSKEKFLLDLYGHKDDTGTSHSQPDQFASLFGDLEAEEAAGEILIAADEFTNFTGAGNYEFISLLGELWDCPSEYLNRVKNSKSFTIKNPCVNMLSGNTPTGFAAAFPPDVVGQGFISRLILVYGERTDVRVTIPKAPCQILRANLVDKLSAVYSEGNGAVELNAEAYDAVDWLYKNWIDLDDMRFANYSTRRLTHMLKLCLVFSAMRVGKDIIIEDVIAANTLLTVTEEDMPKALGEFGKGKYSDVANKILDFVLRSNDVVDTQQIWKHVSTDLEKVIQLSEILAGLVRAEKLQATRHGFLPVRKVKRDTGKFFDLSLIGGR